MTATQQSDLVSQFDRTHWDVVIIGGGPAGGMAALSAAQAGCKTLLLHRRHFPREKVCGGCLNARGLALLNEQGLASETLRRAMPITSLRLCSDNRQAVLPLPTGAALSRSELDLEIVQHAVAAGATLQTSTKATVLARHSDLERRIQLDTHRIPINSSLSTSHSVSSARESFCSTKCVVSAKLVILATGLGAQGVQDNTEFATHVRPATRIGFGTTLPREKVTGFSGCSAFPPPGEIRMAIGQQGYVGMVAFRHGDINIAAAVDRSALAFERMPGAVATRILRSCGIDIALSQIPTKWRGTGALTQSLVRPASQRILVAGDAAGYAEPFTGEGIAMALESGLAAGELAGERAQTWDADCEHQWETASRLVRARGAMWRWVLPRLIRSPAATKATLHAAAWIPLLPKIVTRAVSA